MLSDRLTHALATGALSLPDSGTIAVIGARGDETLDALERDRMVVVARHRPDFDAFTARGYRVVPELGDGYAASIIHLPRARDAQRHLVATAAAVTDGPLIIDGPKSHGVEAMLKDMRQRADVGEVVSKAHGKLFTVTGGPFDDWVMDPTKISGTLVTLPGVFSADGVDPGTQALIAALPPKLKGHVVDLGAGWGALSLAILEREGVERLDLVEADHFALEAARLNVRDPRARFHWADALRFSADAPADHVVTNPPFHTGRAADPGLGQQFIRAAARILSPKGDLWLVANRHLPYEHAVNEAFRTVRASDAGAYKIIHATGPRGPSRKG